MTTKIWGRKIHWRFYLWRVNLRYLSNRAECAISVLQGWMRSVAARRRRVMLANAKRLFEEMERRRVEEVLEKEEEERKEEREMVRKRHMRRRENMCIKVQTRVRMKRARDVFSARVKWDARRRVLMASRASRVIVKFMQHACLRLNPLDSIVMEKYLERVAEKNNEYLWKEIVVKSTKWIEMERIRIDYEEGVKRRREHEVERKV